MIIPSSKYPAQTAVDLTNYPQGKARNVTASGDGTGTPLEKDWLNDIWGFFQALVAHAGITPSGNPDSVAASDLLNAVCAAKWVGVYALTMGVSKAYGVNFAMTQSSQFGGFSLASDQITVPLPGKYRVSLFGNATSTDTSNPAGVSALLYAGAANIDVGATRYTATNTVAVRLSADYVFTIANPATEKIYLVANSLSSTMQLYASPQLVVERVG